MSASPRNGPRPPTDVPGDADTAMRLYLEALDLGFELAIQGTCALDHVDREEALRRVARSFADEDRRRDAALIRMCRADSGLGDGRPE